MFQLGYLYLRENILFVSETALHHLVLVEMSGLYDEE